MKTKLVLLLMLIGAKSNAQTATLTAPNLKNTYTVRFEDNKKEKIEITITDSEKNTIAQKLLENDDTSISFINKKIAKTINDISADFYYTIPKTKISLKVNKLKEAMSKEDFYSEIKKLPKEQFISLLKTVTMFAKESKYKSNLNAIAKINDSKAVFNDTVFKDKTLKYKIVKTAENEYKLFNDDKEIKIVDPENFDGFFGILYNEVKNNDDIIALFFTEETFQLFKDVDILTIENTLELEKEYGKMRGEEKVTDYNYMGYIGTNFDLVEGVKAKNVFFAMNILSKPKRDKDKIGFYISLYGNRTLSKNDSIRNLLRNYRVYDSVVDNQTQRYSQRQLYDYHKTVNIDNLGAYFSPLFKVWKLSNLDGATQFFMCPSLEFIWRRISVTNGTSNIRNEASFLVPGTTEIMTNPLNTSLKSYQYNSYDFNMGGGFWLIHENKKLSVRLNMNLGWIRSFSPNLEKTLDTETLELDTDYLKTGDIFYTGKLWMTESSTGITLQAEILNTLNTPNPFYGVTLSKAFDFEKLGNFFKPITTK